MSRFRFPFPAGGLWLLSLLAAFIGSAFICAVPYPDDHDGVNFILGVKRYDVQWHQPHFPGYPVYIAVGKLATLITDSAEWGLIWVSILTMAFSALAMASLTRERAGWAGSMAVAMAMMANPILFQFSRKIFSEPMGLALLLGAALAIQKMPGRAGWPMAGFLLGLMLGVRLSWWPLLAGFYYIPGARKSLIPLTAGIFAGSLVWLVPMVWLIGIDGLISTGTSFTQGHFGQWGNTAVDGRLGHRGWMILRSFIHVAGVGAGGWAVLAGAPVAAAVIFGAASWRRQGPLKNGERALAAGAALYLAWLILGQNVDKARHFIPLLPITAMALAPAAKRSPALLLAGALVMAGGTARDHFAAESSLPPAIRMAQWLDMNAEPGASVYCGWAERYFDLYDSRIKAYSAPRADMLETLMNSELAQPSPRYICDDIPGISLPQAPAVEFSPRLGDVVDRPLRLYIADR